MVAYLRPKAQLIGCAFLAGHRTADSVLSSPGPGEGGQDERRRAAGLTVEEVEVAGSRSRGSELLMAGVPRDVARDRVRAGIDGILNAWLTPR